MKFIAIFFVFLLSCSHSPRKSSETPSLREICRNATPQVCGDAAASVLSQTNQKGRAEARSELAKSCKAGYANSCDWLGNEIEKEHSPEHTQDALALPWYEMGCNLKLASACNHASLILWSSPKVKSDKKKAIEYSRLSCKYDPLVKENCRDYAQLLYYTKDENSWIEAVVILQKGCDSKDQLSCLLLGIMTREGMGTAKDLKKAFSLFSAACTARYFRGCSLKATIEKNPVKQLEYCKEACEGDDPYGCNCMGHLLTSGNGIEVNPVKSAQYYERSCNFLCEEQNCDESRGQGCAYLADKYRDGAGVEKSNEKAVELLSKSCNMHYPPGCYDLAYHLENGLGVKPDIEKAMKLYEETCNGGLATGCISVAYISTYGPEKYRDAKKAYRLLSPLCEKNNGTACNNLAELTEKEFFGKVDFTEVTKLYRRACQAGDTWGCAGLGILIHQKKSKPASKEDPFKWINEGCKAENEDACKELKIICKEFKYKDKPECH